MESSGLLLVLLNVTCLFSRQHLFIKLCLCLSISVLLRHLNDKVCVDLSLPISFMCAGGLHHPIQVPRRTGEEKERRGPVKLTLFVCGVLGLSKEVTVC